jgi:hypothetical protein
MYLHVCACVCVCVFVREVIVRSAVEIFMHSCVKCLCVCACVRCLCVQLLRYLCGFKCLVLKRSCVKCLCVCASEVFVRSISEVFVRIQASSVCVFIC